jgi:hypothetical protein
MRTTFQFLLSVFLLLGSNRLLFAQDDFYNRDSSGYTYRIGPVLPKIQQAWQLGALGRDFTFGFNPSGVNIENYVLSLLNLPDVRMALQASTGTDVFNIFCFSRFKIPPRLLFFQCDFRDDQKLLSGCFRTFSEGFSSADPAAASGRARKVRGWRRPGVSVESAEKICSGGLGVLRVEL